MGMFSSIASGVGSLFSGSSGSGGGGGGGSIINTLAGIGDIAGGAYDLYRGVQNEQRANDYLGNLYASQKKSDSLLQAQADRAKDIFYPIEDLQAEYALEDLKRMRDLQVAQQQYGIDRGEQDIAFAKDVMDPARDNLLEFLASGVEPQRYMDIAVTDVNQAFDKSLGETSRAYGRMGINPNSGAMTNLVNQNAVSKAAAQAGARTEANRLAEDLSIARKSQALNAWQGIPLSSTQSPTSGSVLAGQAAAGFQDAASNLSSAAKLSSGMASDYMASAKTTFNDARGYLGGK